MIVLANKETALNKALQAQVNILKVVPYSEGILPVVMEMKPQIVVLSPFLPGKVDPAQVLYDLTMLEQPPRIILLAGNMEKKDQLIQEALSSQVYDIVFNPDVKNEDLLEHMVHEILDRIQHPRNRKQVFEELGISSRKQAPTTNFDQLKEYEEDAVPYEYGSVPLPEYQDEQLSPIYNSLPQQSVPKVIRPYIVGVISPSSCGSTFVAQNVAASMALDDYNTALIDFDGKRTLQHWFGRDINNRSFIDLFEYEEINDSETIVPNLNAFTSFVPDDEEFHGDVGWLKVVESLPYEVVVLDFSSGQGWRKDLILRALEQCDEVMFVVNMDYAKSLQSRRLWDALSQTDANVRLVMNQWDTALLPCEERDLAPIPPTYRIPILLNVYKSIISTKPLAAIQPELKHYFVLKDLRKSS